MARVVCVLARIFLYIMEELDPALFTEGGFARDAYQPLLLGGLDVVAASTPVGHHTDATTDATTTDATKFSISTLCCHTTTTFSSSISTATRGSDV